MVVGFENGKGSFCYPIANATFNENSVVNCIYHNQVFFLKLQNKKTTIVL